MWRLPVNLPQDAHMPSTRPSAARDPSANASTLAGEHGGEVFVAGNSHAVRLPREFRFNVDRVAIRREGDSVVLSPPCRGWADYLQNAPVRATTCGPLD